MNHYKLTEPCRKAVLQATLELGKGSKGDRVKGAVAQHSQSGSGSQNTILYLGAPISTCAYNCVHE